MSPPSANTRSRSATPSNTPAKANPPGSVGKLLSALTLCGSSPESDEGQQKAKSRENLFAFLGTHPKAHEDDQLRAEFSSLLEEYTKAERAASSDPIFCISRNYFGMKEYKLVLIGGAAVGKSAYVEKLKTNRFISKYEPTDKVDVTSLVLNTNLRYPIKIDFWDTAGSEKHAGMRDGYFVGADAAILMYDVSSKPASVKELTGRYTDFVRVCAGVPIVLAGNKAESSSKRKVQQKDAIATFRRRYKLQRFDVSTKNGLNFEMPLLFLLKKLTGESDLKLVLNDPSGKKSNEKIQTTGACTADQDDTSKSSPDTVRADVLESKLKLKNESLPEAENQRKLDVSVAAATPLPKIDEEGM